MRKAEVLSGRMWTGVELLVTSAKSHAPYSNTCSLYVLKVYVPVFYVCKVRSENYGEMWSCVWWWCVTVLSHNDSCWSSSGESPACTMCCETVERFLFNVCVVKQSRDSCSCMCCEAVERLLPSECVFFAECMCWFSDHGMAILNPSWDSEV